MSREHPMPNEAHHTFQASSCPSITKFCQVGYWIAHPEVTDSDPRVDRMCTSRRFMFPFSSSWIVSLRFKSPAFVVKAGRDSLIDCNPMARLQPEVMPSKSPKSTRSKKPKNNPHAKQPSSEIKESQCENMSQLLNATIAGINAIQIVVPSDLAKGILGTVANILMTVQSVVKNKSDLRVIVKKCKTIGEILERVTKDTTDDNLPRYLDNALSMLNLSVNDINEKVVSRKEQGLLKRFFSATIDRDQIASWEKDIDRVLILFSTEVNAGMAMRLEGLVSRLDGNPTSVNILKHQPIEPPSRPSMFYGRDDLVAELMTLVVNGEHIALIGPGGMGKSSLAKAILHEPLIIEKFADRRFFVAYDDLDPSTITFETFMIHFAGTLGIEITGADPLRPISTFLRSASALVVLDNAETFEEASASSALEKIPPAIAKIADIRGVVLTLTSRSRRNATDVLWRMIDIPPLDLSSAERVFFQTYPRARCGDAEEEIMNLLRELDFHPLSINSLAHTARQNDWSPAVLLKARMCTFTASVDELFVKSSNSEDHICGLQSKISHWRAKLHYGGDIVQMNERLENLLLQCTSTQVCFVRCDALLGLAEVAFCEGRLSEAMDILQKIIEMFEGEHSHRVLWYTMLKAVVASKQGDHALARELIYKAPGSFQFFELRSAFVFLHRSYAEACIELTDGAYDKAESHFIAVIEGCNIQGHLDFKAYSKRELGEIAFAHDDFALAARYFTEILSVCAETGVPERHLYSCEPFYVLPDRFCGWTLFLEGQSSFANMM
ncbi:hypothetical protein EV424DRAFT_258798 [Suillus variegatus]|nr:hypothetical protein EV424DRAFT_258798 [Suillus variegatus]